jgi:hypothetical protein
MRNKWAKDKRRVDKKNDGKKRDGDWKEMKARKRGRVDLVEDSSTIVQRTVEMW